MKRSTKLILALVAAALAYNYYFAQSRASGVEGGVVVYGAMSCGWTKRQLDYLKSKGIPHKFVDCESGACPKNMKAFPVVETPNGQRSVGYTEL